MEKRSATLLLAACLVGLVAYLGLRGNGEQEAGNDDNPDPAASGQEAEDGSSDNAATGSVDDDGTADDPAVDTATDRREPIGVADLECPDVDAATKIAFAYSVEKETLMDRVVASFNRFGCGEVEGYELASGLQMSRLAAGWPDEDDGIPVPHLVSPSTILWTVEANAQAETAGFDVEIETGPDVATLGWAPLVAAMPESVADEIAPDRTIALQDLAGRAGTTIGGNPFILRKTNPEVASTGFMALLAAYAAGTDLTTLTAETLAADESTRNLAAGLEAAAPVYGTTSLSVLEQMCVLDNQGRSPAEIVSALLTEEQLVVDYNRGTGDFGCENSGRPNERLVAVYLDSPTPVSAHPVLHVQGPWVNTDERLLAESFIEFVTHPETLDVIRAELGVRDVEGRFPSDDAEALGVSAVLDPAIPGRWPQPTAEAVAAIRDDWHRLRQPFRIHLLVDLSGSMGVQAGVEGRDSTRLDEVKTAIGDLVAGLRGPRDAISITAFPAPQAGFPTQRQLDLTVVDDDGRARIAAVVDSLSAEGATPLYDAIDETYRAVNDVSQVDPDGIDVLVVLTDGLNEVDSRREDWTAAEIAEDAALGRSVAADLGRLASETPSDRRLRIFTISYGPEALEGDEVLRVFAERTFGQDTRSSTSDIAVILRSIISRI